MTRLPAQRAGRRGGTPFRQAPRIRRRSAGLTPVRAAAGLALLVSAGAIYGLAATSAVGYSRLEVTGAVVTSEATVRERLDLDRGANLVTLATEPLERRLAALPAVRGVEVSVVLPDTVRVELVERIPILVWQVEDSSWLVDREGVLFADLPMTPGGEGTASPGPSAEPSPAGAGEAVDPDVAEDLAELPRVIDSRAGAASLRLAATLDAVDLDAATRLAAVQPTDIGSAARGLLVRVSDENGFTLRSVPSSWVAIFGFYGRSQRTTEMIPAQVQLLQRFLLGRESQVSLIVLADGYDGTYVPKPSASPSAAP